VQSATATSSEGIKWLWEAIQAMSLEIDLGKTVQASRVLG